MESGLYFELPVKDRLFLFPSLIQEMAPLDYPLQGLNNLTEGVDRTINDTIYSAFL